jgi:hypothetical protein
MAGWDTGFSFFLSSHHNIAKIKVSENSLKFFEVTQN